MRRFLLTLFLLSLGWAAATTYRVLTLDEMLAQTQIAFYGEVVEVTPEAREGEPWTLVEYRVLEPLSGLTAEDETVTLAYYGGTLPSGESLTVSLMPRFEALERVLVLAYDADYYSPIVGFRQGLWRETPLGLRDETGRLLSLNEDGELALEGEGGDAEALLEAIRTRLEEQP